MPEIIFDNCVLSNFALSGSLDIIRVLYGNKAYITDFVAAENMKGITQGYNGLAAIRQALLDGWLQETTLNGKAEADRRGQYRFTLASRPQTVSDAAHALYTNSVAGLKPVPLPYFERRLPGILRVSRLNTGRYHIDTLFRI